MIRWTEQAIEQLDRAREYIAGTNSAAVADEVTARIFDAVQRLAVFPLSGRRGRVRRTRELIVVDTPFVVAYTVNDGEVVVLALYHGAQRWPEAF